MATLKIAALMVLLYGIIKDSWAAIFFAMILWEIGGGFVLTSLFYLTNRSGEHRNNHHNEDDHGS